MKWLLWPVSVAVMSRVLAVIGRMAWLFWPVSMAVMSRVGRDLLLGVAGLARIGGRYERYWPVLAVWRGCSGPYRWPP